MLVGEADHLEGGGTWGEYMCERGTGRGGELQQTVRQCMDRGRWRLFFCGHSLEGVGCQRLLLDCLGEIRLRQVRSVWIRSD